MLCSSGVLPHIGTRIAFDRPILPAPRNLVSAGTCPGRICSRDSLHWAQMCAQCGSGRVPFPLCRTATFGTTCLSFGALWTRYRGILNFGICFAPAPPTHDTISHRPQILSITWTLLPINVPGIPVSGIKWRLSLFVLKVVVSPFAKTQCIGSRKRKCSRTESLV
jgi:hypothetical protein